MHFKNLSMSSKSMITLFTLASLTGCGILGAKKLPDDSTAIGDGCLNNSKDLVSRYSTGDVSESEWKSAFDCVDTSLNFFTEYVRGSTDRSYTQSDMYTFISRFIITNRSVDRSLLSGLFQLKTAILGGEVREFTKEEIATFKTLLPRIRDITTDLIPAMRIKSASMSQLSNYFEIADAFTRAGEQINDALETLPVGALSKDAIITLLEQMNTTLGIEQAEKTASRIFLAKWIASNTRPDQIDTTDWSFVVKSGMSLAGLALAVKRATPVDEEGKLKIPNILNDKEYRAFLWEVMLRAKPFLDKAIEYHQGTIPFPLLDQIVETFKDQLGENVKPHLVKDALRPIIRKVLGSKTKTGIDQHVLDLFYVQGKYWIEQMQWLDQVYEAYYLDPLSATREQLNSSMSQFANTLSNPQEKNRFLELQTLLLKFKPQFYRDTKAFRYAPDVQYTTYQHHLVILFNQAVRLIHEGYGSEENKFDLVELEKVYDEYIDLFYAMRFLDGTVKDFPSKVMNYLDIFTYSSNGDRLADFDEIVDYALMIVSSGVMVTKVRKEITSQCDQSLGTDNMDWTWISVNCFRNEFFGKLDYWLDAFPRTKVFWNSLTADEKLKAARWLEHGSRLRGYTDDNVASFDMKALPTVLHYVESMFTRYDENQTELLGKSEVFNAFPVFRSILKTKIGEKIPFDIKNDYILKGIFAYVVKYQSFLQQTSAKDLANLAWMIASYRLPTTKITADRLTIFNIVCNLSVGKGVTPEMTVKVCQP